MKSYLVETRCHCFICREKKPAQLLKKSVGRVLKFLKRSEEKVLQRVSRKVGKAPIEVLWKLQGSKVLEVELCQSCWNVVNEFEASFGILEELRRRVAINYGRINEMMKEAKETVGDSTLGMKGTWELEVMECVVEEMMEDGIEGLDYGDSVDDVDGMELGAEAETMNEDVDVWTIDEDEAGLPISDATADSDMEQGDNTAEALSGEDLASCQCLSSGSESSPELNPLINIKSEQEKKPEVKVPAKDACPAEIPILPEEELFREWNLTKQWSIDKLPHKSYAPLLQGKRFRLKHCADPETGYTFNCPCGKVFPTKGLLEDHLQLKYYGLIYHCDYCDNRFLQEILLTSHQKKCHIKLAQHKVNLLKCKRFGCFLSFYSREDLDEHVRFEH